MVNHVVLMSFKEDTPQEKIDGILEAIAKLKDKVPGIVDYSGGRDCSIEGLNQGYTHGFVMTFESKEMVAQYLPHPDHQRVVDRLLPMVESILVFDYQK